jgi:hypothetical protein
MTIYKVFPAEGYEWVEGRRERDWEGLSLNGAPVAERWITPEVSIVRTDDRGKKLRPCDVPWFSHEVLVLTPNAVHELRSIVEPHGELLPLRESGGDQLFALNVVTVLDALDEERSDLVRFTGSGRIMVIKTHVFRSRVVNRVDLFKLPQPQIRSSSIYVSDAFVARVREAHLRGIEFEKVWEG